MSKISNLTQAMKRIKELESELKEVKADREIIRASFISLYKDISKLKDTEYYSKETLLVRLARVFSMAKSWYW